MSGSMGFDEAFRVADLAVRAVRPEGLKDIERIVLEGSWYRDTYDKIALEAGYTTGYLSKDVGPSLWETLSQALGVQVKKTNFRTAIERWSEQAQTPTGETAAGNGANSGAVGTLVRNATQDPLPFDVTDFRGREADLKTLGAWILQERGRLLCLSGLPGVGKSWFAVKLADQVRSQFQRFIYHDLSDRPTPDDLIAMLLTTLAGAPSVPEDSSEPLDDLIQALVNCPSLIILDATETLCCPRQLAGGYAPQFAAYQQLLAALASREHRSCIVWVGRELPRATSAIAGSSCRRHVLAGLAPPDIATLAVWPSNIDATEAAWHHLSHDYGGLPALILTEIAPRIPSFSNQLEACLAALQQEKQLVYPYIDAWLEPLSEMEWQVITWMMLSQRPLTLSQLNEYLGATTPLGALESLCDRGICEALIRAAPAWQLALPALLSPYLCDRFLQGFIHADAEQQSVWLSRYALIQPDAPEMVRQWQRQTLLTAVAQQLETQYPHRRDRQVFLKTALQQCRVGTADSSDYRPGNLVNLAHYWHIPLVAVDLRGLRLQGADLQSDLFQGVSFAGADLTATLLAKPMGQCPVIAIHPQGQTVAVGDQDGRLLLWSLSSGRLHRAMLSVPQAICAIAFSPDGNLLAEARQDGTVRFWDLQADFGPERFAETTTGALTTLAFSPDQALLAGGDETGNLHVWQLASGAVAHQIPAHAGKVTAIAFSPGSRRLLSCGQDCAAQEWDLDTGQSRQRFQGRLTNLLGTVAYVPTMAAERVRAVVVGRDEGQLIVWDLASARPQYIMNEPCETFMALALSPDGRYLAASDLSNTVAIWDIAARSQIGQITESCAPVESLAFSPDSSTLMTGCDYAVEHWDLASAQCLRVWRSDRHPARQLTLSTEPLQLLSSHEDHTLRCWQFVPERQRWLPQERLPMPQADAPRVLTSSLPPLYWAVGTETGHIHVWDRQKQAWLRWGIRLPTAVTALAFSPDGQRLAAGDELGTVALWDLPQRVCCWQKAQAHADQVMTLTFAPDGQRVYSGSRDRSIGAWHVQGDVLFVLQGHRRRVHTLCLSADGQHLYSGSYDGSIQTWQAGSGKPVDHWQQNAYIHAIALDAQHRPIALTSDTQTLSIWEIDSRTCRATCTPTGETLWHVSTSADGHSLVCASQTGEIGLWSLATGDPQGQLRVDRPYEGMQISGCLGLTDSERQMLYSLGASDY